MLPKVTPLFAANFRSSYEAQLFQQMLDAGVQIDFERNYESRRFPVEIPARTAHYTPDYWFPERNLAIEAKGLWDVANRSKVLLFREQYPDVDYRMVFQRSNVKLFKGSKTTLEQWAKKHGFVFAIGAIPPEWIEELTHGERDAEGTPLPAEDRDGTVLATPIGDR